MTKATDPAPLARRITEARRQLTELTEQLPLSSQLTLSDGIGMLQLALERASERPGDITSTPAFADRIGALLDRVERCWVMTGVANRRRRLELTEALNRDIRDVGRTLDDLLRLADPEGDARTRRFRLLTEIQQRLLGDTASRIEHQLDRLDAALRRHHRNDEERGLRLENKFTEYDTRIAAIHADLDARVEDWASRERAAYEAEKKQITALRAEADQLWVSLQVSRTVLWTDDGTRKRELRQADRWRQVAFGFGTVGLSVLVFGLLTHRTTMHWPTLIASLGVTTTAGFLVALCLRESAGHRAHERRLGEDQRKLDKILVALHDFDPEKRRDFLEQLVQRHLDGDGRTDGVPGSPPEEQPALLALIAQLLAALVATSRPGATEPGSPSRN